MKHTSERTREVKIWNAARWKASRIQCVGCRLWCAGCRVHYSVCRVKGVGCKVNHAVCRVYGLACRVLQEERAALIRTGVATVERTWHM